MVAKTRVVAVEVVTSGQVLHRFWRRIQRDVLTNWRWGMTERNVKDDARCFGQSTWKSISCENFEMNRFGGRYWEFSFGYVDSIWIRYLSGAVSEAVVYMRLGFQGEVQLEILHLEVISINGRYQKIDGNGLCYRFNRWDIGNNTNECRLNC